MEGGNETVGETEEGDAIKLMVSSSAALRKDMVNLSDFIERLKNEEGGTTLDMDEVEELNCWLRFIWTFVKLSSSNLDGYNAIMSWITQFVDDRIQPLLFNESGDEDVLVKRARDLVVPHLLENIKSLISSHSKSSAAVTEEQLVDLLDALIVNLADLPKYCVLRSNLFMTHCEVLLNVCGNVRDFLRLKVDGYIEHEIVEYALPQFTHLVERVGHFCFFVLSIPDETDDSDESDDSDAILDIINVELAHLLVKIIPIVPEIMHICSTNLKASKSSEVGNFIKRLVDASPDILREYLIHLQEYMVTDITTSTSTRDIHVMIEFLLIILNDVSKDFIHHDNFFDLLARVGELSRIVSVLVHDIEEKSQNEEESCVTVDLLGNIELLKGDLKHVYLKAPCLPRLRFQMSDGPLFMNLLLKHLNDLLSSNAYSVALIHEEIRLVKEDLEFLRSFFGNVEQDSYKDLWIRVLDVAYEAEHAINSILVRDHGLLQFIFFLPDTIEKIKLIKQELPEKIPKIERLTVENSPKKRVERKSSTTSKIIVGFKEETDWIIRKLTSGPAEIDVISIVGMPGVGKSTLSYSVYNDKCVVRHFDVLAWCTVDQEDSYKETS